MLTLRAVGFLGEHVVQRVLPAGCIKDFDPSKDYFGDKATFGDARDITVSYHKSYKVVTLKHPSNTATKPVQYVLVQCGAPDPHLDGELAKRSGSPFPPPRWRWARRPCQ
ncbi:vitamin B12 ABC transporter [Cutibacterium acnes JCM 18918]|nr:vitamin B12 ABC transporter [Cutibacterium acnes JCM 18918]